MAGISKQGMEHLLRIQKERQAQRPKPKWVSKPVGGFDLVLGPLFNEGWWRESESYELGQCNKCGSPLMYFPLYREVQAFGKIKTETQTVTACKTCLNESSSLSSKPHIALRSERRNNRTGSGYKPKKPITVFKRLTKEAQEKLLNLIKKGED
jgi:hypothetical protein